MRSEADANQAIERYADMVRRICMVHLKNEADTEDVFQTVFLKYVLHSAPFESVEHEKAWFIRVTINACKDLLRDVFRAKTVPLEQWQRHVPEQTSESREVLMAVLALPAKYRLPLYLYYYEGYSVEEVGRLTGRKASTVQTQLARGRERLKNLLKEVGYYG